MGEETKEALKFQFDKRLRLEFHGARITSDTGLTTRCHAIYYWRQERRGIAIDYPVVSPNPKKTTIGGDTMAELAEKAQALNRLIRPLTFPIGVKLVKSVDDFPERTRRPVKDMGCKIMPCVGITLARKYGWTVGVTSEDSACRSASYAYGWSEAEAESEKGMLNFVKAMNYAANDDAAKARLDTVNQVKLDKGQYAGILFSPLDRSKVEPDLVMVYCNPAQVMRLVAGATQGTGASLHPDFRGFWASCMEGILNPFKDGQSKLVLPGNGERVWAMVQDDETLFTIPAGSLDQVIAGLEATHQSGVRYPIPVDVRHAPNLPKQA